MHVLWTRSRLEGAFWIRGCFLSPPTLFRGSLLLFCIQSKSMVSFLKPTVSPPLRATTVPMHLPSCILGSPPEGGSGLGGTRGSHRAWGPLGRPLPPCTGQAGVQSQRAGARLRAGMLAPAEGGQGLPRRAWPGAKRGDEEEAGHGWGFLLGREKRPGSRQSTAPLAEGRKWLCLLCITS